MKRSLKTGFSFGLTSGIITTLGLIVGLYSGTHSQMVIIGGIMTIAIADSFSDALGIHISQESENKHPTREVWESTISTFVAKFLFALIFIIPIILLPLLTAIIASIILGFSLLGIFSYYIAKEQKVPHWKVIGEHVFIAFLVIVFTHFTGVLINSVFG